MRLLPSHPYWHLAKLIRNYEGISSLYFSHYRYTPQSIVDERHTFLVDTSQFLNEGWINYLLESTPRDRELAIHSSVLFRDGSVMHIPMADMSTTSKAHLIKLEALLEHTGFGNFEWYASGRSFHGYGDRLLNDSDWTRLMGALLLANQRGMTPVVDPRWIGHRLLAGYSALRWTKNTSHYVDYPANVQLG